jgi:hypothetical protein
MNWKPIVIIASTGAYLYILITEWVDLFPWNDVSRSTASQKLSGSLVNAVPFALLITAFLFDILWLRLLAVGCLVAWLGVHFAWWWAPYFWGTSETHLEQYARLFARTYRFLPPRGTNPTPTAQYVIMQVLTLINLIVAMVALLSSRAPPS